MKDSFIFLVNLSDSLGTYFLYLKVINDNKHKLVFFFSSNETDDSSPGECSGDRIITNDKIIQDQDEELERNIVTKATELLSAWTGLKEEFRIPKKERIEQMKEHEREADRGYVDPRENQSYDR